jgi:hypothetical protein
MYLNSRLHGSIMTEGKNSTREESKEDCVRYNVGIAY